MTRRQQMARDRFYEDDKINEHALKNLIRSAIALNTAALKKKTSKTRPKAKKKS